ncbi:putative Pre-mRNA-splicing factor ini1 [Paratrimastix pyriformis]|uniref:Pre-mRNA-splicing factor ini1 n=1 Tax=Paratrimastix pyriformis TaxID=342808 RepID=A0ABQ8UFX3_9EUKA|nr:putative Pre-mRNA-splicing factor ini1 [Paratrimastix pyriformis]
MLAIFGGVIQLIVRLIPNLIKSSLVLLIFCDSFLSPNSPATAPFSPLFPGQHASPSTVSIFPDCCFRQGESIFMAKHHPDLIFCRKQAGIAIGRLCEKDDGKCPICDSYVRPTTLVRICDECAYGSNAGRCVICGGPGVADAYYCKECTLQEKDRDGCPKIVNVGAARTDLFYERKKYGFKKKAA